MYLIKIDNIYIYIPYDYIERSSSLLANEKSFDTYIFVKIITTTTCFAIIARDNDAFRRAYRHAELRNTPNRIIRIYGENKRPRAKFTRASRSPRAEENNVNVAKFNRLAWRYYTHTRVYRARALTFYNLGIVFRAIVSFLPDADEYSCGFSRARTPHRIAVGGAWKCLFDIKQRTRNANLHAAQVYYEK